MITDAQSVPTFIGPNHGGNKVTDSPKRPKFQIHLSTSIVLMFVAGILIWANTRNQAHAVKDTYAPFGIDESTGAELTPEFYGWPMFAYSNGSLYVRASKPHFRYWSDEPKIFKERALLDAFVGLYILLATATFCEWFIHLRELYRRKVDRSKILETFSDIGHQTVKSE